MKNCLSGSFAVILFLSLCASLVQAAEVGVKTCVCRKAKTSRFLELHTAFEDGDEKIKQLQSFTIGGPKNEALCLAAIKTTPECGGKPPELAAAGPSLKLTAKMINPEMAAIGLKAGDVLQKIDHAPVTSEKDLDKIQDAKKSGSRVDVSLVRKGTTLDLWYAFPKEEQAE